MGNVTFLRTSQNLNELDRERIKADWPELVTVEIAPEEQARWRECQDPIQEEFLAEREAKGINAHEIFDEMNRLFQQYAEKLFNDAIPPKVVILRPLSRVREI